MSKTSQKCGNKTITYDSRCSFACLCSSATSCTWTITCPPKTPLLNTVKPFVISGTEPKATPTKDPTVTVAGQLVAIAHILEDHWKRRVIVPAKLSKRKIQRRTLKGTPEEIAAALGLELGARRRRRA